MKFLVIFGGSSFEHEISIVSAITLKDKIKKHSLEFLYVSPNREFYLIDKENMKSKYFASGEYKKAQKAEITKGGFKYQKGLLKKDYYVNFDVAINLIHGRDGEDGKIPGMLEFFGIKAITPNIEASVVSYNKLYTKMYAKEMGVDVIDYEVIDFPKTKFDFPIIIKPARLGSSIGVSVVRNQEEFDYAFDVAREFDDLILVEPFIEGINEYNLAGFLSSEGFVFSKVEKVNKKEYLDFEKKYMDFSRKETKLEEVDAEIEQKIKEAFEKIYNTTFKNALIRCDFFEKEGVVYLNEINPIPGSLANYLFDDFDEKLELLAKNVTLEKPINIDFAYINKIQMAKGK
ncbi:D-alanine--D-alanine ligase [Caminibacter pacificus]|uniref:D-alanine--D-alanine ligase n=1 Tax=Caminibacter pacificus TaxID=1424653 RepID=A0AAJ4RDN3_9BACT|nr:D-alanine--D-alanine ligase [Caminibacter pacificus]QCI28362.1 D-alanine--D-alanine ligase [Caminibacter pacificus]ROR40917.1 D-alanine-D-alanine ligase [Caminibacter pacificus]